MVAAAVIQIDGQQDAVMLRAEFEDELFFALDAKDAVRISENVGAEADFEAVLASIRFRLGGKARFLGLSKFHGRRTTST